MTMEDKCGIKDQEFLNVQRRALVALRGALQVSKAASHGEEKQVGLGAEIHEPEDDAQQLTSIELSEALDQQGNVRLAAVERELQKLDEGSYGLSDESGEVIPK